MAGGTSDSRAGGFIASKAPSHGRATFVFVTRDQNEAMAMPGRIVVMPGGRLVQVGAPREIYSRPRERSSLS